MHINEIIKTLNWFYTLEKNQVDLYTAQSQKVKDLYIKKTLKRVSLIEQKHVENIADIIKTLGGNPTIIGDIIGPLMGKIAGKLTEKIKTRNFLKINIALEEKAMDNYKKFISKVEPKNTLSELLWANLIDEDLHTAWFSNKVTELKISNQKN